MPVDPNAFQLLESILWRPRRGFYLLSRHVARLQRSARYFGFQPVAARRIREALDHAVAMEHPGNACKIRLLVDDRGTCSVTVTDLPPAGAQPWRIAVAANPVDADDPYLRYKTTQRAVYERARAAHPGADDVLLWNREGVVTETTIANLVFDFGDGVELTPAAECGLLPGVYREKLLNEGRLREASIALETVLRQEPAVSLINSVRGRIPARLIRDNPRDATDPGNRRD